MELVGQKLKKQREIKNLTLKNVSDELKISTDIIHDLENNEIKENINYVYLIGHLRSYCSYLELDDKQLIDQFKKEHFPEEKNQIEIQRPIIKKNILFSNKAFSLSLILIIFSSFYLLFISDSRPSREYAVIPDLPENYIPIVESANLEKLNTKIIENKDINYAEADNNINSSSAIAASSKVKDDKSSLITLKFLDDTWIQLRDENDEMILSQLMNKDEEYSYDSKLNYSITSGNAGHILVLINQKVRGKIGKKGQVVESLVLDNNFNN